MPVDDTERAPVYAVVGVHAGVGITLTMARGAEIHIGRAGPDLTMDFADAESLDRLAVVAAEGARRLRAEAAGDDGDVDGEAADDDSEASGDGDVSDGDDGDDRADRT
jgi:hypothetical protein